MKTIGMLGGMSWESTQSYYKIINEEIGKALGGLHSAQILMYSVDFAPIEHYQTTGEWEKAAEILIPAAQKLENAGADFLIITSNTTHKVAPMIEKEISIPLLHIAGMTAEALMAAGVKKTALLGTNYTMTQDFYKSRIIGQGIEVMIPEEEDRNEIHRIIFEELCLGIHKESSKETMRNVIRSMKNSGAEAVIFGCTEIGELLSQEDSVLPVFDTTLIHAKAAAEHALCELLK